jgi:C4-dicarboxylate-specific signal transduction histidine kinase
MKPAERDLATEAVRFFGEISASVSHDIKNVLAIINENAGLLRDMLAMNATGMPLSSERLTRLAASIDRQVARGDGLVKKLNRLAHSADHPEEQVDVIEALELMVHLAGRLIAMRGEPPQVDKPQATVTAITNRFFLQQLIWTCLRRAVDLGSPDRPIRIQAESEAQGVRIRFRNLSDQMPADGTVFPSPETVATGGMIDACIHVDTDNGEIILSIA